MFFSHYKITIDHASASNNLHYDRYDFKHVVLHLVIHVPVDLSPFPILLEDAADINHHPAPLFYSVHNYIILSPLIH